MRSGSEERDLSIWSPRHSYQWRENIWTTRIIFSNLLIGKCIFIQLSGKPFGSRMWASDRYLMAESFWFVLLKCLACFSYSLLFTIPLFTSPEFCSYQWELSKIMIFIFYHAWKVFQSSRQFLTIQRDSNTPVGIYIPAEKSFIWRQVPFFISIHTFVGPQVSAASADASLDVTFCWLRGRLYLKACLVLLCHSFYFVLYNILFVNTKVYFWLLFRTQFSPKQVWHKWNEFTGTIISFYSDKKQKHQYQ